MPKYLIRCVVPHTIVDPFQQALENLCESLIVFEDSTSEPSSTTDENGFPIASLFQVDMLCEDVNAQKCKTQAETAAALLGVNITATIEEVENTNWLLSCHQDQPEIHVHPFIIYSSESSTILKPGNIGLKINAATAFGSGEHPTTQGCLKLFVELSKKHRFQNVLDMGCGSGILSIAAKKHQPHLQVTAVDIEAEAVRRTRLNTKLNGCEHRYNVLCSVGFQHPQTQNTYDLCFANIVAKPLIRLAPNMKKHIQKAGYIIVSGLLNKQAQMVINAYKNCNFSVVSKISISGWCSIAFKKL